MATHDDSVTFNAALDAASIDTLSGTHDLRGILDLVEVWSQLRHADEAQAVIGVRALRRLVMFPHPFDVTDATAESRVPGQSG